MKRCSHILFLLAAMLPVSCGYDDFGEYDPAPYDVYAANIEIGEVMALHNDGSVNIYDDLVVSGYVTANDRSGNFYRVFMIDDGTGGLEIKAGTYDLHNTFAEGRRVAVRLNGLVISAYNGVLQAGLPPAAGSGYQTDYFSVPSVLKEYVFPDYTYDDPQPIVAAAADLEEDMCGRLVRIEGLTLVSEDDAPVMWAVPFAGPGTKPETGYRVFTDGLGTEIAVVTSGYADFAGREVPRGGLSVTGILSRGRTDTGKTMYMLKMRRVEDAEVL